MRHTRAQARSPSLSLSLPLSLSPSLSHTHTHMNTHILTCWFVVSIIPDDGFFVCVCFLCAPVSACLCVNVCVYPCVCVCVWQANDSILLAGACCAFIVIMTWLHSCTETWVHTNESCLTCGWVMSHVRMSHDMAPQKHTNMHICEWVTHVNQSVTRANNSFHGCTRALKHAYMRTSNIAHMNE